MLLLLVIFLQPIFLFFVELGLRLNGKNNDFEVRRLGSNLGPAIRFEQHISHPDYQQPPLYGGIIVSEALGRGPEL